MVKGGYSCRGAAKILGVRTFGKGTILHVVPLPGGGAVRYASAHYVTPGGRVIEKKGIIPDHEVRIPTYEALRLSSQTLRYPGRIKPEPRGTLRDLQLARAKAVEACPDYNLCSDKPVDLFTEFQKRS